MSGVINETYAGGSVSARTRTWYDYDQRSFRISSVTESDGTPTNADNLWDANASRWTETESIEYVADHHNHTAYTQTLRETKTENGHTKITDYTFGHDEITQRVHGTQADGTAIDQTHILGHDGHGSVRVLYDLADAIANAAQVLTFSAYGQLLAVHAAVGGAVTTQAASLTSLGYSGEHFDAQAAQQYLRARFYNPATGTFNRLDPFSGNMHDPQSLHKYLYVHGDPVQGVDPSGKWTLAVKLSVTAIIGGSFGVLGNGLANVSHNRGFFENWGSAFLWGGGLAVVGALFPVLGVALAGVGLGFAIDNWRQVMFDDPSATPKQRWAASGLVILSLVGSVFSARYGANASRQGAFWYNPGAFTTGGSTSFRAALVKLVDLGAALRRAHADLWSGKTTGIGLFRNRATGRFFLAAMGNERNGLPRPQARDVLPPDVELPRFDPDLVPTQFRGSRGNPHAEVRLWFWAQSEGHDMIAAGASRDVCGDCVPFLMQRGVGIGSPVEAAVSGPFTWLLGLFGFTPGEVGKSFDE
jgi:RHS repeat-associated protein